MRPYYQDDYATIYHGDCREVLPVCPAQLVITDPPYSQQTHLHALSFDDINSSRVVPFKSTTADDLRQAFALVAKSLSGWFVSTMDWRHVVQLEAEPPTGLRLMRFGVWMKPNYTPQLSGDRPAQAWEAIAYFHTVGKSKWNGGGKSGNFYLHHAGAEYHPTEKPLQMVQTWVNWFSTPGDLVLDPFMGSGTTLRAAKNLGRKAIGIEIEERYCEIAAKRLAQEVLDFGEAENE